MVRELKLNGEVRTVLFGNLAFKRLKEETGTTLEQIGEALVGKDFSIIPTLLYYGLRAGERYDKKQPGDYDADDVAMWMDGERGSAVTVLPWILEAIEDMTFDASAQQNGEAKKKTAKA